MNKSSRRAETLSYLSLNLQAQLEPGTQQVPSKYVNEEMNEWEHLWTLPGLEH